ncbi:MAG: NAD-dependent succinate-semialdehyde dehydrogenase [Verrucomicrobiota bacterium]|nr:NAD-dependent succinate-semialdehyde dehydrogenase [Verrucomicrobiota bacterium]
MHNIPSIWFPTQLWIDGHWTKGDDTISVTNPADGKKIADVSLASKNQAIIAIEGASRAFESWGQTSPITRGAILKKIATHLLSDQERLARLLTSEQGKPLAQARAEVAYAASFFEWFGEEARRLSSRIAPHPEANREFHVLRKPLGVAGVITPWNFPLAQGAKKLGAALASGCTAVWKPSEFTPLVALAMASVFADAGVPDGVIQIIPGYGDPVGVTLSNHPSVRIVSLTGSTATGKRVMAESSSTLKRVSLELGGNAPFIILPDADLDQVAADLLESKLLASGQVCVTANRIFVPEEHMSSLADRLVIGLAEKQIGPGLDESCHAGPLIHKDAVDRLTRLVDQALNAGARLITENRSFESIPFANEGSYFPPMVLSSVTDEMGLSCSEIFGPVIALYSYSSIKEVICRANQTESGLAGYVYGKDIAQANHIARRLEVGIVGINEWRPLKAEIPFGGIKESGIGVEGGVEGIDEYLDIQTISLPL